MYCIYRVSVYANCSNLQVQVAALEVQNVRKAISRYGTLPKGARIGAYLESLRQSGMSNSQEQAQIVHPILAEQTESTPRSLSPRTHIRTQPQMIRSNSSSGVTTFHASHPPSSPTASKLSKNRHLTRNASGSGEMGLKTFRVAQNQNSFRGGSPSRTSQPSLANLEFPPPPTDLPPPPEEFDGSVDIVDGVPYFSSESRRKVNIVSPLISKKLVGEIEIDTNDVSNLEPSVEEASSRFGVSLKKRDVSTDSCNSNKEQRDRSPQRSSLSLSPSHEGRSPVSVNSDVAAVGSPLEPLPSSNSLHSEHGMYSFIF